MTLDFRQTRPETTPQEYLERGRRILELLDRMQTLRSRLLRSTPALSEEEKLTFKSRKERLNKVICTYYARGHFEEPLDILSTRSIKNGALYAELCDLMDKVRP